MKTDLIAAMLKAQIYKPTRLTGSAGEPCKGPCGARIKVACKCRGLAMANGEVKA